MVCRTPELRLGVDAVGSRILVIVACEDVLPVLLSVLTEVEGADRANIEAVLHLFEILFGEVVTSMVTFRTTLHIYTLNR